MTAKSRILVADDDPGVIEAYRSALNGTAIEAFRDFSERADEMAEELFGDKPKSDQMPWRVDFVRQGQEAFEAVCEADLASDPYTVLFLDIRMPPGIDGCETARRIRQIDQNVHIVFVSGYSDYLQEELVDAAGPEDKMSFMQKPVWPLQLKSKASELCKAA